MPTSLTIVPWADSLTDTLGYDPRSLYAETFWLPTLGPTSLVLLRHLANKFDQTPHAEPRIELRVADTSLALGVGNREGSSSPIVRTLARLEQFDLAVADPQSTTIAVRRTLPPLHRRLIQRLPTDLQRVHEHWVHARLAEPPHGEAIRRARCLALRLLEQGDAPDQIEATLGSIGYHPAVVAAATRWATEQRNEASDAEPVARLTT
jgi:hypothetical protein